MAQPTHIGFQSKVLTANDLINGEVVYLSAEGQWVKAFANAKLFTNDVAANEASAQAETQQNQIVSAFLTNARIGQNGVPEPTHMRERFRANGPSNRFLGKQADAARLRGE
ncbi:MAG: DUF2849 domain-containing protein [Alphaproteobacteria bacterium]|nr:DUF2849 domain-containing protein [Alphaproteobacteria bacterium]